MFFFLAVHGPILDLCRSFLASETDAAKEQPAGKVFEDRCSLRASITTGGDIFQHVDHSATVLLQLKLTAVSGLRWLKVDPL